MPVSMEAVTKTLTAAKLVATAREDCKKHPDVERVTVSYSPAAVVGQEASWQQGCMTAEARSDRARKAAIASHASRGKGKA